MEDCERIFTELIHCIERSQYEVKKKIIRDREKAEVSQSEGLLKQLHQEIDDLKRRDTELQELLHTENHIHFLQVYKACTADSLMDIWFVYNCLLFWSVQMLSRALVLSSVILYIYLTLFIHIYMIIYIFACCLFRVFSFCLYLLHLQTAPLTVLCSLMTTWEALSL